MTNREIFKNVMALIDGEGEVDVMELRAAAEGAIAKLDATNEKRKATAAVKAAEKQAEKEPIRAALVAVMGGVDEPKTASMLIADAGLDIKAASVPSLLRPLVEAGQVAKVDVKIAGKGTQRGYVRAE